MTTIGELNDEIVLDALELIALSRRDYDKAAEYLQRAVKIVPDFGSARRQGSLGKPTLRWASLRRPCRTCSEQQPCLRAIR